MRVSTYVQCTYSVHGMVSPMRSQLSLGDIEPGQSLAPHSIHDRENVPASAAAGKKKKKKRKTIVTKRSMRPGAAHGGQAMPSKKKETRDRWGKRLKRACNFEFERSRLFAHSCADGRQSRLARATLQTLHRLFFFLFHQIDTAMVSVAPRGLALA